ncbi:hypothetical protein [Amycolatopsis kentuckyensis]|uniref:hypothetical protein n=1 Tax=Amycolatopsis kentuckyensis TaxID=218823 RepID=UPI000A3BD39A|nr:hypothetical protein [Amycolatopsis kentuckyensis]
MNISEDELEQRLRALFADERLDLPPPPDAGTVIVTGARRRRRRRHAVQAVAGVAAAVVAVASGLTMFRIHTEGGTAAMSADGTAASIKPPENLTPGRPPEPSTPGPTGTQSIQASAPPGTPTPTRRPPSSATPSTLADVVTGPLLAADGFGKLKLGMSEADVTAQAVTLSDPQAGASCTVYKAQGSGLPVAASVVISKAAGLVVVTPDVAAHTAEGIGAGATKPQILAAYPAAKEEAGDVVAPAGAAAEYRFRLGETGVVQTSLSSLTQDCAG